MARRTLISSLTFYWVRPAPKLFAVRLSSSTLTKLSWTPSPGRSFAVTNSCILKETRSAVLKCEFKENEKPVLTVSNFRTEEQRFLGGPGDS